MTGISPTFLAHQAGASNTRLSNTRPDLQNPTSLSLFACHFTGLGSKSRRATSAARPNTASLPRRRYRPRRGARGRLCFNRLSLLVAQTKVLDFYLLPLVLENTLLSSPLSFPLFLAPSGLVSLICISPSSPYLPFLPSPYALFSCVSLLNLATASSPSPSRSPSLPSLFLFPETRAVSCMGGGIYGVKSNSGIRRSVIYQDRSVSQVVGSYSPPPPPIFPPLLPPLPSSSLFLIFTLSLSLASTPSAATLERILLR